MRNKKDTDGVTLSSISAAWLQARMIAQAGIGPGARVLEIGTTGYNAAVIAEVTGPAGHVVTVDIDPEVAGWAAAALETTGYRDRVTVVTGDGEDGAPGHGPFDAIIATAGAWDIPPSWLAQLDTNGTLVVPLRMNGVTRSIGFASERVSRKLGYVPNGQRTAHRDDAGPVTEYQLRLDRPAWESHARRDRTAVTGLGPCLPMLGLPASGGPA